MKANSDKSKQSNKATRRVLAGVLCGASVLSLVLSLVMPPISQAIANDAETASTEETVTAGGSSTESTDVEKTTNGDAENQDSGDAAGDDDARPEEQSKDESQAEDNDAMDVNAVASAEEAAESEETTTAITNITNADDLSAKLQGVGENQTACFELTADIDYPGEIKLEKSGSNITLDLSGHKITHSGDNSNKPLFNITNNAALTVKDSNQGSDQKQTSDGGNNGRVASMDYDTSSGIPTKLTYYVTESTPNGTGTTETLYRHEVSINGAIVGTAAGSTMRLINVYAGGTFNLDSGVITQQYNCNVGNLIYAENGSTVNMSGGYVCGASSSGAGIKVSNDKGKASTLKLTGGVIAGNSAPSGGGVYAGGSTVTITGGVISGNSTLPSGIGFGGGIMAEGGSVTVSGGYITNNKYANFCGKDGYGDHGGAGLAARNGTHVTISGGQITGNYSKEAGGGVYVTDVDRNEQSRTGMAWLKITGGIIASNVSYRSEGAGIRVGQMVDAMINGSSNDSPVYITNNSCMSRFDWGGGGIFVQGNSDLGKEKTAGRLFIYNSYISANTAGGYGGGVAVCPTGKTLVTNTEGTAIFGNSSAKDQQDAKADYNSEKNSGNEGTPHLSAGGYEGLEHKKNQDTDAYNAKEFRENGHADFFLAAEDHKTPIAAVIGKMLGGGDAKYKGSKELTQAITIPANGGVQVYKSIGLSSGVTAQGEAAINAQKVATTFITGNYSWDHGGGIMSNGDLYMGAPEDTYVYPSLKLKATKVLRNSQTNVNEKLEENQFTFRVYRKDSTDPLASATFNRNVCTEVGTAKNDASGNITFDLDEQFATSGTADITTITYYLVEDSGAEPGITYDSAVYEIVVSAKDNPTELMTVPKKNDPNQQVALKIHNYTIENVSVTKHKLDKSSGEWDNVGPWGVVQDSNGYYSIANPDGSKTFTNKYTPYESTGSWTPAATKVVKGGEMKEFTLEFADNKNFENAKTVKTDPDGKITTTADGGKSQTLSFDKIEYKLDQLNKLPADSTGRGASKTFTYYVREQQPNTLFAHYKYDQSVYQITVNAVDDSQGKINVNATYKQIQDRDGKSVTNGTTYDLTDESTPTFTNTYSTTLPLSGMSGVTLTYLAGAAVLCAAAAWMHIRRKANAKGGKRRE